jgi:hypothetical protein
MSLLASGDLDGLTPIDSGYGRPLEHELEAVA